MNENAQPPEGAISLSQVPERFGNPKLYAELEGLSNPGRGVHHPGIGASAVDLEMARVYRATKFEYRAAAEQLSSDIVRKFIEGYLVAWGRNGTPTEPWTFIPPDAWKYLTPNWAKDSAHTQNDITYFNIRVFPAVFVDSSWDGGLPLLEASKLLDPGTAKDLIDPWAPDLLDGKKDEEWADVSRDWAADQAWRIIGKWLLDGFLSIYIRDADTNEWRHIYEVIVGVQLPDWDKVDFARSQIQIPGQDKPVECVLTRSSEEPDAWQFVSSSRAKHLCEKWLVEISGPGQPRQRKDDVWREAKSKFSGLSKRGFDIAWTNSVPDEWKKSGAPPKSEKTN